MLSLSVILGTAALVVLGVVVLLTFWVLGLRRVVDTNSVHIVQRAKESITYGKGEANGNVYYHWPSWMPRVGIQVITFPVSIINRRLENYEAYDSGRLPFVLDLEAFFRINDPAAAAQRVNSLETLQNHLHSILQGAARTILASKTIDEILSGRSEFGDMFTAEVNTQLREWGVVTVKNIELMDIRDGKSSTVIAQIMDKKKSEIERDSRLVVADNLRIATNAEIDAKREIEINKEKAEQQVGIRRAEKEREVGIARELSEQEIKVQARLTLERELEIERTNDVTQASIARDTAIINAERAKQELIIQSQADKEQQKLKAEADLATAELNAQGVLANGKSAAESEKLLQLAPVEAQIVLAKEIGENEGYQNYLIGLRNIEAVENVGIAQSKALEKSDVKIIANAASASEGLTQAGKVLSSSTGTGLGSVLEGLAQTELGKGLIERLISPK